MSNRIHSIYVALDSHQYAKAVKLASALPSSHVMGRALLAYAFYKSGQSSQALGTINILLGWNNNSNAEDNADDADIVQRLEREPTQIDWTNNSNVIPSIACPVDFADETTLETIAITMQGLNQYEMVYKLYSWAGHYHAQIRIYTLTKQYAAGLQVLVRSTSNDSILASMQALALQMSRLSPSYTAQAARTALWQWQFASAQKEDSTTDNIRLQMLPRLAQSLVKKVVEQTTGCTIEDCFLCVEIYKSQSKWNDLLQVLPTLTKLTPVQNLELQATCWQQLENWESAQQIYQQLLLKQPGQWSYWKSLIQCSFKQGGLDTAQRVAHDYVEKLLTDRPTRSIVLVSCELALLATEQQQQDDGDDHGTSYAAELQTAIQVYAETFASKTSCIFSDLEPYLDKIQEFATPEQVEELYNWADSMRSENIQGKGEEDRYKLRSLIFALQVMQKLATSSLISVSLPPWTEIAQAWKSFPATQSVQKEVQPSDELVLLAVDRLLQQENTPSAQDYLTAATLLEMGLVQSSYSPNLKLRLIGVYQSLHASDRCWELFRDLGIKHIQLDSCTYFILPILLEGGLYQQALVIANETLKFHISTLSDTSDFVARALENGTWSKADEFLRFQRTRMNRSLSLLESKGITMDCAPLMSDEVGLAHGIVGGSDDDANRATRMMEEAHNSTGAPSIVSVKKEDLEMLSDNRDLSILPLGMTASTKEDVFQAALRRKLYHGILIRAAALLDVAKAPKKGKLARTPEVLRLRCSSLSRILEEDEDEQYPMSQWEHATKLLAKVIVLINAGLPALDGVADSLQTREDRAIALLKEATSCIPDQTIEITPSAVGRVIVDHLVSIMAVTKMTADVFLMFGWGKRKKRDSVSALAQFAAALKTRVVQMMAVADSLDQQDVSSMPTHDNALDGAVWKKVCTHVQLSRKGASERLLQILNEFDEELSTFEQEE